MYTSPLAILVSEKFSQELPIELAAKVEKENERNEKEMLPSSIATYFNTVVHVKILLIEKHCNAKTLHTKLHHKFLTDQE